MAYDNNGKSTQDAGYQVKQTDTTDLDTSWRNKGISDTACDLDNSAEIHEDEAMREAHRKIKAIMEMDGGVDEGDMGGRPPNQGQLRRRSEMPQQQPSGPGLGMGDLMEGLSKKDLARALGGVTDAAGDVATDLIHDNYSQENPNEASLMAESYGSKPRNTEGAWKVTKFGAKLKSGKTVPVWKVMDESTGMEIPKPFRIQEPAHRIATIINQTGNVNDQRIKGILEAYDQHVNLMKKSRILRKKIDEGQQDLRPKLQQVRSLLEEVNYKLGI